MAEKERRTHKTFKEARETLSPQEERFERCRKRQDRIGSVRRSDHLPFSRQLAVSFVVN